MLGILSVLCNFTDFYFTIKTWNLNLACSSTSDNPPIQRSVLAPATELNWSDHRFLINSGLAQRQVKIPGSDGNTSVVI